MERTLKTKDVAAKWRSSLHWVRMRRAIVSDKLGRQIGEQRERREWWFSPAEVALMATDQPRGRPKKQE